MNELMLNQLKCPSTGDPLKHKDGELFTNSLSYPVFQGIPWLYKNPEYAFLEWGTKIQSFLKEEETYLLYLQKLTNSHKSKLTRKRLSQLQEAKSKNLKYITKTLAPFLGHTQLALPASTQQIHSYFQLIFRDWVWDSKETKKYTHFCKENILDEHKTILILGAGAGKLSYDLATAYHDKHFFSIDHNPLLFLTAAKIFKGDEVKLSDYSQFPKTLNQTGQQYKIKTDALTHDNHEFILGAFPDLPFGENSLDMIIAPWFFDILDFDFEKSVIHASHYLKDTGRLLAFGPSNIHKNSLIQQLCFEEIEECFQPHFEEVSIHQDQVNYLHNPLNSQQRVEELFFASCSKPKNTQFQEFQSAKAKEIIFDPTFEHHKAVNETFYHILKHINGNLTIAELAKKLEGEFNFKPEEALFYAENFINKIQMDIHKS